MNRILVPVLGAWLVAAACAGPAAGAPRRARYRESEGRRPWYSLLRPARETPAEQLEYARGLRRSGSRRAIRQYRALVASWPSSEEAAAAQWEMARTLDERGREAAAFEAYGEALDRYAGRVPYEEILGRQFEIARETMTRRSARWLFGGFSSPERAVPLLESLLRRAPKAPFAEEARFLIAQAYEKDGSLELAAAAYGEAAIRHAGGERAEEAAFRRASILSRLSRRSPNDGRMAEEAWFAWLYFERSYPGSRWSAEAAEARGELLAHRAGQAYERARYYDRIAKRPESALVVYRLFLERFPDAPQTDRVRRRVEALSSRQAPDAGEGT